MAVGAAARRVARAWLARACDVPGEGGSLTLSIHWCQVRGLASRPVIIHYTRDKMSKMDLASVSAMRWSRNGDGERLQLATQAYN